MTTKTWNGSTADWYFNNGGDWSPPGDPGSSDAVVINSGEAQLVSGDAGISVASISITGGLLAIQDPGVTQSVSGNVSVSGSGSLQLDGGNIGGAGGSSMTIGGTLTNTGPETEELLWPRLEIITIEDGGVGLVQGPMLIEALNNQRMRWPRNPERWMFSAHAVRMLCATQKDRTTQELVHRF